MAPDTKNKHHAGHEEDLSLFPGLENAVQAEDRWLSAQEGQLAVDVYETNDELIIKSAIAGVQPEDLDVFVHNDMLTIRGKRHDDETVKEGRSVVRECHWGAFSRSLILPVEIDADNISATLRNGILTIKMKKIERSKKIAVKGK